MMQGGMMNNFSVLCAGFVASLLLGACSSNHPAASDGFIPTSKNTPKSALQTRAFNSCSELRDYYSEALAQEILTQYRYGHCFGCEPGMPVPVAEFATEDAASAAPDSGGQREISQTNTQEAGVDEADIIETNPNGTEIYVLRRQTRELLVIDTADPSDLRIISRTVLPGNRQPRGMFFDPQQQGLAIILDRGYYYLYATGGGAPAMAVEDAAFAPPPFEQGTEILFYDVSDAARPSLIEQYISDAQYVDARRIGSRIHLVGQFGFPYPQSLYENDAFQQLAWREYPQAWAERDQTRIENLATQIRQHIHSAVAQLSEDALLPKESTRAAGSTALACTRIYHPQVLTRLGLMLISSIDSDGSDLSSIGSINNAWQVYASQGSLYLLQGSGGWWFDRAQRQQSAIYRFDLASGSAIPAGLGQVDGWIPDRFALSEWQDHLRVVSSEGRFDETRGGFIRHHHLNVLATSDMNRTGAVEDFVDVNEKPNETIRSSRFVGDAGYVVTFEQIDPLFTFDLSDPSAPQKMAELDIPGFSTYMHPLGDSHLLTIGRAAGPDGTGVGRSYQLQLFDVSDLAQPARIAVHEPALGDNAYAYSLAEYEPLAFTYLDAAALLSIPVQISSPSQDEAFSGFAAYRIDVDAGELAIREYARVDHKDPPDQNSNGERCPQRQDLPPEGCERFAPVVYNEPLRSVIIYETGGTSLLQTGKTTLLTLSSAKLSALDASADTASTLDSLRLDE